MKPLLTNAQFVDVFTRASTIEEVAERTGLTIDTVYNKASRLRARGVKLKHMDGVVRQPSTDIEALNELIDSIEREK